MTTGDEDLLQRVANGDTVAFAQLYDRFSPRVFGLALKFTGDRQEAQDVLQEVFLELWRRAPAFDATLGSGAAWILMIARGRSIDHLRRRIRERKRVASLEPVRDDRGMSAGDEEWLARSMPSLPAELREVVHLAYARGLTREQIASTLGIPVGTVKTRLRSAVMQMSGMLGHEGRAAP
jgi:RNA polymerase sigma-70 factor (ECF subfamily)